MLSVSLPKVATLREAAQSLLARLRFHPLDANDDASIKIEVQHAREEEFFRARGCARSYFKSRDCELEWWGLGFADSLAQKNVYDESALKRVVNKSAFLDDDQIYFGGLRFDEAAEISSEWKDFGLELFILPLIILRHSSAGFHISVNFCARSLPLASWHDHAESLLRSWLDEGSTSLINLDHSDEIESLSQEEYAHIVGAALCSFKHHDSHKKVVLGRSTRRIFSHAFDPFCLFSRLAKLSSHAFLFLFDLGHGSCFFGASPELLFRRIGQNFETESLAGTRARTFDHEKDLLLAKELLDSTKDKAEHVLVSTHIEARLKEFGVTDLFTSKLEIMSLPYVHHLHRRYHGRIAEAFGDDAIIKSLHPTPAVCGLELSWAKQFIREHENFDRGFYAGPIGYIGKNSSEFSVAIRSALYHQKELHMYVACGIVPGSCPEQEWDELNNKLKNMLSIFD